jgi:hypothetical protein
MRQAKLRKQLPCSKRRLWLVACLAGVEVHGHSNKQLKLKLSHKSCVQQQAAQAQPVSSAATSSSRTASLFCSNNEKGSE